MGKFNYRDVLVPVTLVSIVGSVFVPVPAILLDFMLVGNLVLSLGLFVIALQISDPLKLSALPTILLLSTLYRLCVNISTTRLILSGSPVGQTVEAFGSFIVGGNIGVGLVVFCVLTFIQFLVVAKGSERVAEVAARFTLDAMPGKQMSIDADVRAGLYDMQAARLKRSELQTESRFYGALDGAMKFIKGDAIAGIVIVGINLVGGLLIGMISQGMSVGEAASRYTLLTIGDGLASQIPSLLNSLAAGLVVTRVVKNEGVTLSAELLQQLCQSKMVTCFAGIASIMLAFIPGMPMIPLLTIGGGLLCFGIIKSRDTEEKTLPVTPHFQPQPPSLWCVTFPKRFQRAEEVIGLVRQGLYEQTGIMLPRPQIQELHEQQSELIQISIRGFVIANVHEPMELHLDTLTQRIISNLYECRTEYVDDTHTRRLLDFYETEAPELVSNVVPHVVSLTQLTEILRALLHEHVPIRSLDLILQAIAESAPRVGVERVLLEEVRAHIGRIICGSIARDNTITALVVHPIIDFALVKAERERTSLNPQLIKKLLVKIKNAPSHTDVVLVSKGARRLLAECLEIHRIVIPVIAHEEICGNVAVKEIEMIHLDEEEEIDVLVEKIAA